MLDHALAYAPLEAEFGRARCAVRLLQATRQARLLSWTDLLLETREAISKCESDNGGQKPG